MRLKRLNVILILGFAALVLIWGWVASGVGGDRKITRSHFALDTYISLTAYGPHADAAIDASIACINNIEQHMSAYIPASGVSRLNNRAESGTPVTISDELTELIRTALAFSEATQGAFDITVKPLVDLWDINHNPHIPSQQEVDTALTYVGYENIILDADQKSITFQKDGVQIDLGSIAKGYAADRVKAVYAQYGIERGIIDLGGNIIVVGKNTGWFDRILGRDAGEWTVGIQAPFAPTGQHCVAVRTAGAAVVSSGAYERNFVENGVVYHHILSPFTGYPASGNIDSVSIIGPSSAIADALSTSVYLMGMEQGIPLAQKYGYETVIITKDKKIYTTMDRVKIQITDDAYSFGD